MGETRECAASSQLAGFQNVKKGQKKEKSKTAGLDRGKREKQARLDAGDNMDASGRVTARVRGLTKAGSEQEQLVTGGGTYCVVSFFTLFLLRLRGACLDGKRCCGTAENRGSRCCERNEV